MPFKKGQSGNPNGKPKGSVSSLTKRGLSSKDTIILISMYEKLVGSFKANSYYVYEHCYNGECFYVGKGIAGRAWDLSKDSRNDTWSEYMETIRHKVQVNIIACGLTQEEAFLIERALISERNPSCNIRHSPDESQPKLFN